MPYKWFYLALVLLLTACSLTEPDQQAHIEVVDFAGHTVRLDQAATRIIALAPHLVENTYTAGAGQALVGVVAFSDYPEQVKNLPIVGGYEKTNIERVLELQPDLILSWQSGNSHHSLQQLRELGLTVYIDQADSLTDIAKTIRDIGQLAGTSKQAEAAAQQFLTRLNQLKEQYQQSVLERNPEAIIASGMSEARPDWLDQWREWSSIEAVRKGNLFFVNPDHIQRHTIRILQGIERICEQLDMARARRNK